jgi:hypothetical protein
VRAVQAGPGLVEKSLTGAGGRPDASATAYADADVAVVGAKPVQFLDPAAKNGAFTRHFPAK